MVQFQVYLRSDDLLTLAQIGVSNKQWRWSKCGTIRVFTGVVPCGIGYCTHQHWSAWTLERIIITDLPKLDVWLFVSLSMVT